MGRGSINDIKTDWRGRVGSNAVIDTDNLRANDAWENTQQISGAIDRKSDFQSHALKNESEKIADYLNEKIKHLRFDSVGAKNQFVNDTLDKVKEVLVYNFHKQQDLLAHVTDLHREVASRIEGAVDRALSKMNWSADSAQALDEMAAARVNAYDYAIDEVIADKVIGKEHGRTSNIR